MHLEYRWERGNEYWSTLDRQGAATGKEKVKFCRNKKYTNCAQIWNILRIDMSVKELYKLA